MKFAILLGILIVGVVLFSTASPRSAQTAFPGENGPIVFRSDRSDDDELWVMGPGGSNPMNVTNTDGFDHDPAWNADGTRIAYFSCRDDETCELYVMNADGSNQVRLTDNDEEDYDPTWSPDGKRLAFSQEDDPEVYVINADGTGGITDLTDNPAFDGDPAWSPDGKHIAFSTDRDGNGEVYAIDADGGNPTNLTNSPLTFENNAAWSPDGSKLAYTSEGEIWVMNANGSGQVQVTDDPEYADDAAWSPDGTMIAFTSYRDDEDGDIYVLPFTGVAAAGQDNAVNITNSPGSDSVPDWGPLASTPTPSPSPTPSGTAGDADCDDDVDSVDALQDLRFVAGLQPVAKCIEDGNVKCDDDIDSVDALFILRHVAALPVILPNGCPEIGS